jgi:predicted transcriptional regulator
MKTLIQLEVPIPLYLDAETAADLMTPNPVSIHAGACVREAVGILIDKGISAAPVIDAAGQPVGVLSRSDVLTYDRERVDHLEPSDEFFAAETLATDSGEVLPRGFQVERVDRTQVRDLMTPIVFSVQLHEPGWKVVREMLARKVHRLFVVDDYGVLVGVISALDVLRHLRPDER